MDYNFVLMVVFLASMVTGLGLLISVMIRQRKEMKQEQKETGYYQMLKVYQ